jgi:hypothetical protein
MNIEIDETFKFECVRILRYTADSPEQLKIMLDNRGVKAVYGTLTCLIQEVYISPITQKETFTSLSEVQPNAS